MHAGVHASQQVEFERVWRFFAAASTLPCDRIVRLAILCALYEAELAKSESTAAGATIAVLADRIASSREVVRHALRTLRADGLVMRERRNARTEYFRISDTARKTLGDCLAAFSP